MAEFYYWLEGINPMTVCTGCRKCFLVIIGMAAKAFGFQPEVGELLGQDCFAGNKPGIMTILACFFCMCTCQWETRQIVIELFFLETQDLKINPMVIIVAA
jgi:hypothetical protein